jgi:hypothetical protein
LSLALRVLGRAACDRISLVDAEYVHPVLKSIIELNRMLELSMSRTTPHLDRADEQDRGDQGKPEMAFVRARACQVETRPVISETLSASFASSESGRLCEAEFFVAQPQIADLH